MKKLIATSILSLCGSMSASADNLFVNGDFTNGLQNWTSNKETNVNPNLEYESNVVNPGNVWDWNLSHPLALEPEVEYKLTFRAKASVARELIAGWGMNAAPWGAEVSTHNLTTEWQTFEITGFAPYANPQNSRLIFDYGHQAGTVFIDDVKIEPVGPETNLLENADFSDGLTPWNVVNAGNVNSESQFESNVTWAGNPWDWSLNQPVSLKAGVDYRLKFRAKSSQARELQAGWGKNDGDWAADMQSVTVTPEWQEFEIEGPVSFGEYANSRVIFDYGHNLGTLQIDDVVFEEMVPQTEFVTEDTTYTLGEHTNENGQPVITEVFYDVGSGYLTPAQYGGWIIDNPQASTVDSALLLGTVDFKGLYVEDCVTGEWINIQNTEYAYTTDPLSVNSSNNSFTLNHFYAKTIGVFQAPLTFLNEQFLCSRGNTTAQYDMVVLPGVDEDGDGQDDSQMVLSQGTARFAYVVEHQ